MISSNGISYKKPVAFKPIRNDVFHRSVTGFMQDVSVGSAEGVREPQFRASSLPYCPLLFSLTPGLDNKEYKSNFYFKTGTAIHELIQEFGPRIKRGTRDMWGDWICSNCGAIKSLRHKPLFLCKKCCDKPNTEWLYKEVEVEWNGFSGHIDTILRVRHRPLTYGVLDYKTILFKQGSETYQKAALPYASNVFQVESYSTLIRELFNLNVGGWSLIYVTRAKPIESSQDYHVTVPRAWTKEDHDRTMSRLTWAANRHKNAAIVRNEIRDNGTVNEKALKDIVANRPCRTEDGWNNWMKPAFKYNNPPACPHLGKCQTKSLDYLIKYFSAELSETEYYI